MKNTQELLYRAGNSKWLSTLDLFRGYWQIPMDEKSKQFTAFKTHTGVYQWKVMSFELVGASFTFQKGMNKLHSKHAGYSQAYIDGIVIFSNTWEDHLKHLKAVLEELQKAGLAAKLQKCSFAHNKLKFLGHKIGSGKHGPYEEKLEAIRNLARPTTKKEVK